MVNHSSPAFNILIIFSLIAIVLFNQILSLGPLLERGLDGDDWTTLALYNVYKSKGVNFWDRITSIWITDASRKYSNQFIYIGMLNDLLGLNYRNYEIIGLALKTLATLAIYPLIFTLFKSRLLAFVTTFLYSILPQAAGALTLIVTGVDYLALLSLCFFGISYYNLLTKGKGPARTSFLLLFTIMFSVVRIYPVFFVILLIEVIIIIKNINRLGISKVFFTSCIPILGRLLIFYIVIRYIFLKFTFSGDTSNDFSNTYDYLLTIYKDLTKQNWSILFVPLSFLGFSITDNKLLSLLLDVKKLVIIFSFLTLFISWLIKPKRKILFSLIVLCVTLVTGITILQITTDTIMEEYRPAVLLGAYYLILGVSLFLEWFINQRSNRLLLGLSICPFWALLFAIYTWINGHYIDNLIQRYLVIPTIGTALFIAILFILLYRKVKEERSYGLKKISIFILIWTLALLIFTYNIFFIRDYFITENKQGRNGQELEELRNNFINTAPNISKLEKVLVYFELDEKSDSKLNYSRKFLDSSRYSTLFDANQNLSLNCRRYIINDFSMLKKVYSRTGNGEEFTIEATCLGYGVLSLPFKTDEFYAYLLRDGNFYDIKEQTLARLQKE